MRESMRLGGVVLVAALALVGCTKDNPPCDNCGAVSMRLPIASGDVARVVATITGAGITAPVVQELSISGSPAVASGTVSGILAGSARTLMIEAFPALSGQPEGAVVIYRGSTSVDVVAGQTATATLVAYPVTGNVDVTAPFPDDADRTRIDHVAVRVSGARIDGSRTYYLAVDAVNATSHGTAAEIPVGLTRTFEVTTYAADGTALHRGSATAAVAESGSTVTVTLTRLSLTGSVSVGGGFCVPSCGSRVCGDDGCQGSCGGCQAGVECTGGYCGYNGFVQPPGTVALNFTIDATGRAGFYSDGDLEWKGSFMFDAATRILTYDPSWAGPYASLYDDGPWTTGGHEPEGSTAGDDKFGITAFLQIPTAPLTIEYGAQTKEGGWIWTGFNGSITVPASSSTPITAAVMTLSPAGNIDMKLMLNTNQLDPAFVAPSPVTPVQVKGTFSEWIQDQAFDDGTHGDATASDGIFTYTLSQNSPARLLLNSGAVIEFIWVLNGVEYKVAGMASFGGASAQTQPSGGSWANATIANNPSNGNTQISVP